MTSVPALTTVGPIGRGTVQGQNARPRSSYDPAETGTSTISQGEVNPISATTPPRQEDDVALRDVVRQSCAEAQCTAREHKVPSASTDVCPSWRFRGFLR